MPNAPDLSALLDGFPMVFSLPVQWGDQDAFRHVNNTVYFRWFESARIDYTRRLGLGGMLRDDGVGLILASMTCDYRRPITFPDTVHVGSRIVRIGRTSFAMEHGLVSEASRALAAEGRSTIVVYDYAAGCPVPVDDEIRQAIATLEGRAF